MLPWSDAQKQLQEARTRWAYKFAFHPIAYCTEWFTVSGLHCPAACAVKPATMVTNYIPPNKH